MKNKYNLKIKISQIIAFLAVMIMAFPCFADPINAALAKEVGNWPAQVLLAAVAIGSIWFSYYSWKTALSIQVKASDAQLIASKAIIEMTHELKKSNEVSQKTNELLEKRPCIVPAMANIIVKDQSQ